MRTTLLLVAGLSVAGTGLANPVSNEVADHFKGLVAATADGVCPDRDALVRDFGRFGLDLLEDTHRAAIRDEFDRFAPILIDAQRPGHQLSHDIEVLFLRVATDEHRASYRDALLDWLTAEISAAPAEGSMIIEYPPGELPRVIGRHRARAAEMVADFGDARAIPLIDDLLGRDLDEKSRRSLERSRARLLDPCAAGVVSPTPEGELVVCIDAEDVASLSVDGVDVDQEGIETFVALLRDATGLEQRRRSCCRGSIRVELVDGTKTDLYRNSTPGGFRVEEKDSVNYRRQWRLASADLWQWHDAIRASHR